MIRTSRLPLLLLLLAVLAAPTALADTRLVYSQGGIAPNSDIFCWGSINCTDFIGINTCDTPEGGSSIRMREPAWGGFGFFHVAPDLLRDLSAFQDGELRFWLKTPADLGGRAPVTATIKCDPGTGSVDQLLDFNADGTGDFLDAWGYDNTSDGWQEISIPICDFFGGTCDAAATQCLQKVESPFVLNLTGNDPPASGRVTVWVDYVRWVTPNHHTGASSVTTSGRQLVVNGKPFSVNGMNYQPISVGENWQGAWRDRPDRYTVDLLQIAASGANTVRLYAPILSSNLLDTAWNSGLFVIPNFAPDDLQLTCPEGRAYMQDRFLEMVEEWGDHPAILYWQVGNEVASYLSAANLYTDFFPQLNAMAAAAQAVEGPSAHPVGTTMSDIGDICLDGTSDDTALLDVDLWGTNVYRGCDFGTGPSNLFTEYANKNDCNRPLIVTEFGADSWASLSSCSVTTSQSCFVNGDCPPGTCSVTSTTSCHVDTDCPSGETCTDGEFCDGAGIPDEALQASCLSTLLSEANAALAIKAGGVSSGQVVFEWLDEWWKAACLPTGGWEFHDTCANFKNLSYTMDPAINEEWYGVVANESFCSGGSGAACVTDDDCMVGTCSKINDPSGRVNKTAYTEVGNKWLGGVCDMKVDSHVEGGATTISFSPTAGNPQAHNVYYGPLSAVSSYGYSGSEIGLSATSPISVNLPTGSYFWLVAAENGDFEEGCYGTDSAGAERPCFSGNCGVDQISGWNCLCSSQ